MADVTGPISTLPGAIYAVGGDGKCDSCGKDATIRIQGETDSFGCEMHDLCDECAKEFNKPYPTDGKCDWCHQNAPERHNRRDYEEGLYGRVYMVCEDCIERSNAEIRRENDEWADRHGYDDYDFQD